MKQSMRVTFLTVMKFRKNSKHIKLQSHGSLGRGHVNLTVNL